MELNTISLSDFTALATVIFEKEKASLPREAYNSGLFQVVPIPKNSGDTRKFTEVDMEEYADNKAQSDQASRANVQQGYSKIMEVKRVAKDIGISYEMREYNKYPEVVRRLTSLAKLPVNRMELDMQHRFGFGTTTSMTDKNGDTVDLTTGDGFALFYTAHTLKGSSTTYRNRIANNPQLSEGALEAAEKLVVEETYNHLGEKVTVPFDILWTTDDPNTCNAAMKYLKSVSGPTDAHAGVMNVYKGKYRHVKLSRVATTAAGAPDSTKAKYWGIASSMGSDAHLGEWEQPRLKVPKDLNAGEEFSTDDWNFGVRAGYGITILSGAWVKFSSGDGTA